MSFAAVSAGPHRTELYRIRDGRVESRTIEASDARWSDWTATPFDGRAIGVAAISGWPEQIEVFVLDDTGAVFNRWWWTGKGWLPSDGFSPLGRPFDQAAAPQLAVFNAGGGHFNLFVSTGETIAMLPHLFTPDGLTWQRCKGPESLGDGWWPAFGPSPRDVYRLEAPKTRRI
jgi:hypothetical protein